MLLQELIISNTFLASDSHPHPVCQLTEDRARTVTHRMDFVLFSEGYWILPLRLHFEALIGSGQCNWHLRPLSRCSYVVVAKDATTMK